MAVYSFLQKQTDIYAYILQIIFFFYLKDYTTIYCKTIIPKIV